MAYAALVSLAKTIEQILRHCAQFSVFLCEKHRVRFLPRETQRIRSLHDHVVFLQSFLEEFTMKLADNLERRIRDTANEAEGIVEYFMSDQIQSFHFNRSKAGLGNVKHSHQRYDIKKLYEELQKVTEEIDSIVGEVMEIKNLMGTKDDVELITDFHTAMVAPIVKDSMIGFDKELMAIKTRLCGESSKLQVIPIFGMGGIGKTTLAKNAYDDPLTMEHFHVRAWVTVSQDYSIQRTLYELLVSLKALNEERTNVLDDARRLFPDDNNGSRIILTTRLWDVAAYANCSSPLHEMQFMDVDQSWNLLRWKVFKDEHCLHELEEIGRTIARSCRGLPLAIVVIAGILSMVNQTRASWENVAKNVTLAVSTNEEQFSNILSLSYTHLPHHLRSCFLYMGGFPKDYEIHVSKLIKLWTAEGFIKPSGSKSYEESAEEYLEDLVKRSLILVTKRKFNGKIKSCNVHDLVRDLCIRKAQEEKFLLNLLVRDVNRTPTSNQRRVSIHSRVLLSKFNKYDSAIRTILCFPHYQGTLYSMKEFKLLRVLDSLYVERKSAKFPTEVLELIFLRPYSFAIRNLEDDTIKTSSRARFRNLTRSLSNISCSRKPANTCAKGMERFRLWEKLAFPKMLKRLKLRGVLLHSHDMVIVGSLPNLEALKLRNCSVEDCKWETNEGEFPRLKFLQITDSNLQQWITESSHFPCLERLMLCNCRNLGEIPDVIGEIPTLELIEVYIQDRSLVESAKRIEEEQQSFGNDSLQVRVGSVQNYWI
ncbi:hypothetical protein BUALT_Bualt06G0007200 [Buddleja alternifolia]|uniref:NB-ARC domain-containing protein n=1 Tax=Buddleja alternifolia TaxID=168488 RepID=A0AAV6XD13_9LAMI|nr:hypothetical protein BUALT_Bualt06G0007200 [Buddleja alternifolia]